MTLDVDVRALTDTALWERITWCARSQDMWARQMAAANNGERGPAYRQALAQWKEARGRIWRRWASMVAGPSCAATVHLSPSELDARLVAWDRRAARLAGHMRTMETDGQAWRRVHTQWQWACLHGEAIRRLRP